MMKINILFISFIILLILEQVWSLKIHQVDENYSFYHDDKQIQYETDLLISSSDKKYSKKFCNNDHDYKYMQISQSGRKKQQKLQAIVVCNIHAREFITSQICLKLMKQLKDHEQILEKINFKIFYRANKMREYTLKNGDHCIRKNQNQVDMNRNFPTEFDFYQSKKRSEIYPGTKPFSEKFTICLNQIIQNSTPDIFLDIHSGQRALYYQEGINNENQVQILQKIVEKFSSLNITKITTLKKDGESINGHIFADLKVRKNVTYSLLYETYGIQEKNGSCFDSFNPATEKDMIKQNNKWTNVILFTLSKIISQQSNQ